MDNDPERVEQGLHRLAQLLLRTETVPETILERARRLVRPTTRDIAQGIHTNAVKLRMRRTLLNNDNIPNNILSSNSKEKDDKKEKNKSIFGPEKVIEFEKNIDLLRRRHVKHWQSFLVLLEPLAASASMANRLNMERSPPPFSLLSQSTPVVKRSEEESSQVETKPFHSESLLPYGPPPILSDEVIKDINNDLVWIPRDTELLLIRELLLVFQGINSEHIKLDDKTQCYVLHPKLCLPPPVRDVVLCLCEVGWLYKKVKAYVERVEENQGRGGQITQAFAFSLQNALNDYFRLLAVLEQELTRSSAPPPPVTVGASNHTVNEGTSGLTLLRLRAWMIEPLDRMCLMARITDCAVPLTGGGLISRLHGHSYHGDERLQQFVVSLMKSVSVPLYNMITRWVLHGELLDPMLEFFICKNVSPEGYSSVGVRGNGSARAQFNISADYLWHHYYKLNLPMLPAFISQKLAYKILVVGKSINFMKACIQHGGRDKDVRSKDKNNKRSKGRGKRGGNLPVITMGEALGDVDSVTESKLEEEDCSQTAITASTAQKGSVAVISHPNDSTVKESEEGDYDNNVMLLSEDFEKALRELCRSYGDEVALSAQIHDIAEVIETRLLNMVLKKFNLFTHLAALKKFMLLGQGDFVTCLMDTVGGELKRRANQLFRHNLTGLLDGALRSCNAQYEPVYVLERLGVRLLEPSPGDSGWEIFSLDYAIDPPLAAVIHASAINKYRIAFHMLWRLKRVEWSLSGAWKNLFTFHHTRGHFSLTKLKPILHRCAIERGKMTHFINSLNNFLMFEVVETAWVNLLEGIERATCLDDIISCHDAYLDDIQERALLSEEFEGLNMQIQLVLQAILRFCNLEETMVGDALSVAARRRYEGTVGWCARPRNPDGQSQSSTLVSTVSHAAAAGTVDGVPSYIISRLEEAAQDYERQFDKMLQILHQQGEKCGHLMRFLTFRLDLDTTGQPGGHVSAGWGLDSESDVSKSSLGDLGPSSMSMNVSKGKTLNTNQTFRTSGGRASKQPLKSSIQQR